MELKKIAGGIWDSLTGDTYFIRLRNAEDGKKSIFKRILQFALKEGSKDGIVLKFDMIEECIYKSSSTVTTYAVENGYNATEYKYDNPDVITIRGVIQRTSLAKQILLKVFDAKDSVARINDQLSYLKSGIYAVDIQTKSGLRENYTLTSYEIPEDFDNYGLLEVSMTFNQILTRKEGYTLNQDGDTISSGICRTLGLT